MEHITEAQCKSKEWDFPEGGEQINDRSRPHNFRGAVQQPKLVWQKDSFEKHTVAA